MAGLTIGGVRNCVLAALLLTAAMPLAAATWRSSGSGDSLVFESAYDGQPLQGRFDRFEVSLETAADSQQPRSLRVKVDTTSANMDDREVNATLAGHDWFDSAAFPVSTFTSDRIVPRDDGGYLATGSLELKGSAGVVTVRFSWTPTGRVADLTGTARLLRSTWHLGTGDWADETSIPDPVAVRFEVTLQEAP